MSNISYTFGCGLVNGFKVGIEFELEFITAVQHALLPYPVNEVEDNSLRVGGRELVTNPLDLQQAVALHKAIFNGGVVFTEDPCTERCSTHVHVNFSDIEVDKVRQFIRLYAIVEPLFFSVVNADRQNNIYCVPLASTNMLGKLQSSIDTLTEVWHKYCAFNVKRLYDLGTIEFRHFQATSDSVLFSRWLKMIEALYNFNLQHDFSDTLSDAALYRLVNTVSDVPYSMETIKEMCAETIVNDLLLVVNPTKQKLLTRLQNKETV